MNYVVYKDILEQQMIPSAQDHLGRWYILVQEDDQMHTVKIVVDFLVRKKVTALDWPPQRPNLNVIENLTEEVERCCLKKLPWNKEEFQDILQSVWNSIKPEYCAKLAQYMPR